LPERIGFHFFNERNLIKLLASEMGTVATTLSAGDHANLPRHVAVIMGGKGCWAKLRHLPRIEGHRRGADLAR